MQYLLAIFMLLMVSLGGYGTLKFLYVPDGAAWIQCIWSVIAVMLAFLAPQWQSMVTTNAAHRRQLKLLASVVRFAESHLTLAAHHSQTEDGARDFFGADRVPRFRAVSAALASFPVTALHSPDEVTDLMMVRAAMAEAVDALDRALEGQVTQQRALVLVRYQQEKTSVAFKRLRGPDVNHLSH